MTQKPNVNSAAEMELEKAQKQFDAFDANVKEMTLDRMNMAPKQETEEQTKLSQIEIAKAKDIYLKPKRTISSKEKFNEKFRSKYEYDKQYVKFKAENKEIIGESIELWSKPYPGLPCENWIVPVNTPVWGPRYLAQQISRCNYHRLKMEDRVTGGDGGMQFYGQMAVDTTVARLEANPVSEDRHVFMGAKSF